jgi:putative Flp pilus-assembly TadE/G-like protein
MTRARDGQRGAVIVIVALWLPLLALFTSFAIDAGHWWDYSRNLQNRADAAALAGGDQLAVCLGTPSATSIRAIGEVAQEYSGPPVNTPDGLANLPYSSLQMTTDGFPVGWTTPPYYNVPNLGAGSGANYHVLLNSSQYWPAVAQNGANGYGDMGSFCNAVDPTAVAGDPGACLASSPCAMVDARLTQASVPGFFNLLGFRPNITAHARVQLQVVSGSGIASPIGVGDDGQAGCVVAQVYDESNSRAGSNGVLAQWSLNQVGTSTTWTGSMPGNLTIPGTGPDLLALRAVIPADCSQPLAGGDVYDASHGIVFINTYKPLSPPVANPARGSVWLTGGSCTSGATNDPYFYYFTSGTCPVTVNAQVDFPNPGSGKTYGVSISMDGGAYVAMNPNGTDAAGNTLWRSSSFPIQPQTGKHTFALSWYLTGGSGTCTTAAAGSSSTCQFDGGNPVQATFSAFADGTTVDDSGPVIAAGVGCDATSTCPTINGTSTSGAASGVDSLPGSGSGSSPKLTATITLQGLAESGPADKATVLRSSVQSSGRTGIFDCGQGLSGSGFQNLMLGGGCGTYDPPGQATTSGLQQYSGPLNSWANCVELPSNPITCGEPVTGNMRGPVHDTIATLICGDFKCQNTPSGKACDFWQPYKNGTGPLPNPVNDPNDPRAIEMVITSPQDLALASNDPRWIRILGFATFYVTGWDGDPYLQGSGTTIPGCDGNVMAGTATNYDEPYPYPGGTPNNAVWGHFIQYVFPGQGHQGQNCVVNQPFACTPALTR